MTTWITADNTFGLWAFIMVSATIAIILEQRYQWAAKLSGAVIALIIALCASNFNLVPTDAPVYDVVWGYIVPLAIPLLLFQINIHTIFKESGRLLFIFLLSSIGTMLGVVLAFFALKNYIPELDKISGMIGASYTGGGVNFAAMVAKLEPSQNMVASTTVADNLMMVIYIIILIGMTGMRFFRKNYPTPYINEFEAQAQKSEGQTSSEAYWQPRHIGLKDIAINLAASMLLVGIAFKTSTLLKSHFSPEGGIIQEMIFGLFTDKYLLLTSFTFLALLIFKKSFAKLSGGQELGTYGIYIFFVVIGLPASIPMILTNAPLLFAFVFIVMIVNLLVSLGFGKLFKYNLEEILLVCNANIGGPTTAAALAISKGWTTLIGPIMVVGTVGYVIGNYVGTILHIALSKFM